MNTRCPVHPQDCHNDDRCDHCLEFMNTCDQCLLAGNADAFGAWHEGPNDTTICTRCAEKETK